MFIDSHCHISKEYYSDIDGVINDCIQNNINKMIISGCDKESISESVNLINSYDCLYATIGFHPSEVFSVNDDDLDHLKELIINNKKIVGVGEIGLDYYYDKDSKDKQIELFKKQLKIAEELDLPVVIHSRDAVSDTINILKEYNVTGVIHCFSGSFETACQYIKMGYKLGVGGVITFKNSKLSDVISQIDLDNIVLETDSPYLSPEPYRGKLNSPKNVSIVASKIALIKGVSINDVGDITSKNIFDVFKI